MAVRRGLLAKGNAKLGESIFTWSIPAVHTCPGRSNLCESVCYATKSRFRTSMVQEAMEWRYAQSKRSDFVEVMTRELFQRGVIVLRVHSAGDFATPSYTQKWVDIAAASPQVTFFAYTRSYRIAKIEKVLRVFGVLPNVKLWYSADCETSVPEVPPGVRIAWLQHNNTPAPAGVDLVFQVKSVRAKPGQVPLPLVCVEETPQGKECGATCSSCQSCWK